MLVDVLDKLLGNREKSLALMRLISLEGYWKEVNLSQINTQEDFLLFVNAIGQTQWFKGHDRTLFPTNPSQVDEVKKAGYEIFTQFGLFDSYDAPSGIMPHFSLVLGASASHMQARLKLLVTDLEQGIKPKLHTVYGLGSNRTLAVSVCDSKEEQFKREGIAQTEMELLSYLTRQSLMKFPELQYLVCNAGGAADRRQKDCATTISTAGAFKSIVQVGEGTERPCIVFTYSTPPFAERQRLDVQEMLGDEYRVIVRAERGSCEEFFQYERSVAICCGEVARLIYGNLGKMKKISPELEQFAVPLTKLEIDELDELRVASIQPEMLRESGFKLS